MKLVVVMGMHRSGTSAITRGLQVMGVSLGTRLMPAAEGDNPTGFWEDLDIYDLNNEMLTFLHSDWQGLAPLEAHQVEELRKNGFFLRAVELRNHCFGKASCYRSRSCGNASKCRLAAGRRCWIGSR